MSEVSLHARLMVVSAQRKGEDARHHFTEMCCGTEAGSYLRLIDSCTTQLKAQGPSRTCNESKEEEKSGRHYARHIVASAPTRLGERERTVWGVGFKLYGVGRRV